MQFPHKIAVILLLGLLAHFAFYPILPEFMATHFGHRGKPNGWMSKEGFIIFEIVLLLLVAFLMFGLPRLLKNFPRRLVNIPNRHYWLADKRKESTLVVLHREMGWIFVGILCLFFAVNQLVYQANLGEGQELSNWVIVFLIAFFTFIVIWVFRFRRIFRLPEKEI